VKPAPFTYRDPRTLEEALDLLAELGTDATLLAGGQSLVPMLNFRLARPSVLVDLNRIGGLDAIEPGGERVTFGALARASAIERDAGVAAALPVIPVALKFVGHPPIRNRTTIGGNLAHADPASELPAVLAALDGRVTLASRSGRRTVAWDEFFQGVFTTARRPDELVVEVDVPRAEGLAATFVEIARRRGDFALVGACVAIRRQDGSVAEARVALCGVGGGPVRARGAEAALTGRPLTTDSLREARARLGEELEPFDDVHATAAYRRHAAGILVARAAAALWERSAG
jgi:aerobic carbon-monoxide dehydrogenase medium subunit